MNKWVGVAKTGSSNAHLAKEDMSGGEWGLTYMT